MRLLCFDPGATTGVADLLIHPTGVILIDRAAEISSFRGIENFLEPDINGIAPVLCICELLTVQHPTFRQIGVEVMGAIHFLCYLWDIEVIFQPPSKMEAPRRLHPLKKEIRSEHARDAIHHGIAYAYQHFNKRFVIKKTKGYHYATSSEGSQAQTKS